MNNQQPQQKQVSPAEFVGDIVEKIYKMKSDLDAMASDINEKNVIINRMAKELSPEQRTKLGLVPANQKAETPPSNKKKAEIRNDKKVAKKK